MRQAADKQWSAGTSAVLSEAERDHQAGSIVSTPFRWHDDLRASQLPKQAHLPEDRLLVEDRRDLAALLRHQLSS
jgi:hypothetical protein